MKESRIESRLVRMVRDRGGLCYKFVSPGNPGVPDRIVILESEFKDLDVDALSEQEAKALLGLLKDRARIIFPELKTEVGRLAAIQKWQHEEMRKRGADVRTLKGLDQVKAFVEEVFSA